MINTTRKPALGDTVALASRLLFDHDFPREGVVTATRDDGKLTAEFPQEANFPLIVTAEAEHFTLVRRAPEPVGYVVFKRTLTGALSTVGGVFGSAKRAEAARPLFERDGLDGDAFTICRLVPEAIGGMAS